MADKFVQVVFSNPVAGREDEFNEWYDNVHIPELLTVPGMLSATRYALHEAEIYHVEGGVVPEHKYMCVYEMEGDVDAIMGKIQRERRQRSGTHEREPRPAELAVVVLDPREDVPGVTAFSRRVEVIKDFLDSIGNLDFEGVAKHLSETAVMTMPFLDGLPPTEGRAAITEQLGASVPLMFERMNFFYDAFYDVRDSDTVIAEYHSECPRKGGAGVYRNSYITVFGFDGEKIALYKEYLNPARMTRLT